MILGNAFDAETVEPLVAALAPFRPGRCPVYLDVRNASARGRVALGDAWRVSPNGELLRRLRLIPGVERAELLHARMIQDSPRGAD